MVEDPHTRTIHDTETRHGEIGCVAPRTILYSRFSGQLMLLVHLSLGVGWIEEVHIARQNTLSSAQPVIDCALMALPFPHRVLHGESQTCPRVDSQTIPHRRKRSTIAATSSISLIASA